MPSKTSVCLRCWNICACHQGVAYHQSWQPPNGCILAPFAALGMTEEGTKKFNVFIKLWENISIPCSC